MSKNKLARVPGFEPGSQGFGDLHVTVTTHRRNLVVRFGLWQRMRTPSSLFSHQSTTNKTKLIDRIGDLEGTRTLDLSRDRRVL